jgi:hypothetical protein
MAEQQFDVFLCHNSDDQPAVIEIAQQLQQNGLKPWLDVWELQPGAIWQFGLEQQIESIRAAAVFVGKDGLGPWQSEEVYAFLQEFMRRKCPVIPVMLPDTPQQPKLPIFLRNRHWVDFRLQNPDPLVQLVWGITGIKPQAPLATAQVIDTQTVAAQPVAPPTPAPTPEPEDDLSSEKGIDYTRLRDLLKAGQWRNADQETADQMLNAMGKEDWWEVERDDLLNFPCADLTTIDQLWVTYSKGKWGFNVQKQIYVECGAKLDGNYPGDKIWLEFCGRVGWRKEDSLLNYSDLTWDPLISPAGEFPVICGGFVLWVGGGLVVVFLFSRIETCKL